MGRNVAKLNNGKKCGQSVKLKLQTTEINSG